MAAGDLRIHGKDKDGNAFPDKTPCVPALGYVGWMLPKVLFVNRV
jgi:hypothetical protein